MTGTAVVPALITGRDAMLYMAQHETASVSISHLETTAADTLRAVVTVTNKAGHYLPSGVGFRRVFLEFLVLDAQDNVLWASGRTNALGAILDGISNQVLASEQPVKFPQALQPHYAIIDSGDKVQIYEERITDAAGNLTTSFVRRETTVKDNRLRPIGFDVTCMRHPLTRCVALGEKEGRGDASRDRRKGHCRAAVACGTARRAHSAR